MTNRTNRLVSQFEKLKIDALLVTKDENVAYLTDFPASESWLLVTPRKNYYITDFRYVLEARQGLTNARVYPFTKSIFKTLFDLTRTLKIKRLGFDDRNITLSLYKQLKKHAPKRLKLVAKSSVVENLRIIKEKEEIAMVKKALKLNLKAYDFIRRSVKPGKSEQEILLKLEQFVKSRGARFSFDPIVASGPNSCFPHAKVTTRKCKNNEPVLIDMGIDIGGYKSDLTRMFFLGKIPEFVTKVNSIVADAQAKAIAKIKPDIPASVVDREARNHIAKNKLGKYFGHSLGHGVGLEIHEAPAISQKNPAKLKENMIFTVEPAVYIPNKFGIRIEDMVLVSKDGCQVLSR